LPCVQRRSPHVFAINKQHIERDIDRLPPAKQQVIKGGPPTIIERHDLAIEPMAGGQGVEQRFEPL
jgi:hypothetical protein